MKQICQNSFSVAQFNQNGFYFILFFTSLLVTELNAFTVERLKVEGTLDQINNIGPKERENEPDYTGPAIENERITLKFMTELLKFYNDSLVFTYGKPYNILPDKYVFMILKQARDYFKHQPSLIEIKLLANENITICGGIHGKLLDLLHIFALNGLPSPKNRYLFNGDVVGRRFKSIESTLIYFGFKLLYPNAVFINRGHKEDQEHNHGPDDLVEEVRTKYPNNHKLLHGFWEVFQWMPLAHVISSDTKKKPSSSADGSAMSPVHRRVLVSHGGIFPKEGITVDDIRKIERGCDPSDAGQNSLMYNMLWSDWKIPEDGQNTTDVSKGINQRSITARVVPDVSKFFCKENKIDYIIRNLHPLDEGYRIDHDGRIVSLISTAEFTGTNKGAIVVLEAPTLIPKFTKFRFEIDVESFEKTRVMKRVWMDEKDIALGK